MWQTAPYSSIVSLFTSVKDGCAGAAFVVVSSGLATALWSRVVDPWKPHRGFRSDAHARDTEGAFKPIVTPASAIGAARVVICSSVRGLLDRDAARTCVAPVGRAPATKRDPPASMMGTQSNRRIRRGFGDDVRRQAAAA